SRLRPSFDTPRWGVRGAGAPPIVRGVAMAEQPDPARGQPLGLRVEISAEGGGSLLVSALRAGLRARAPPPAPPPAAVPGAGRADRARAAARPQGDGVDAVRGRAPGRAVEARARLVAGRGAAVAAPLSASGAAQGRRPCGITC